MESKIIDLPALSYNKIYTHIRKNFAVNPKRHIRTIFARLVSLCPEMNIEISLPAYQNVHVIIYTLHMNQSKLGHS
jgi:hypothetical protein